MFPIMRFRIADKSMEPSLCDGDYVLASKLFFRLKKGDVIVLHKDRVMIKRIIGVSGHDYIVQGDNKNLSAPFAINRKHVVGKVIFRSRNKRI